MGERTVQKDLEKLGIEKELKGVRIWRLGPTLYDAGQGMTDHDDDELMFRN